MRKLAVFAFSFAAIVTFCVYIPDANMIIPSAAAGIIMFVSLIFRRKNIKLFRYIILIGSGILAGIVYFTGYRTVFYKPAAALFDTEAIITATVTDYVSGSGYTKTAAVIKNAGVPIKISLILKEELTLAPGDTVKVYASLYAPKGDKDFDALMYYRGKGIFLEAEEADYPVGAKVTKAEKLPLKYLYKALSNTLSKQFDKLFSGDELSYLKALLLGNRSGLSPSVNLALANTGVSHVVALSGMHLTILAEALYLVIGPYDKRKIIVIPFLALYALMTGCAASVLRALVMQTLYILSRVFEKSADSLTSIAAALLFLLLLNPFMITDVGLQLSFLSTLGLIVAAPKIRVPGFFYKRNAVFGPVLKYIASTFVMTLSATLFTLPLLVLYFKRISLISPLTNLLILWSIPLVFIGGMLVLIVSFIYLPAAFFVSGAFSLVVRYDLFVVMRLASFKYSAVAADSLQVLLFAGTLYLLLMIAVFIGKAARRILTYVLAAGFCTAIFLLPTTQPKRDEVRMTLLDVGDGEAILVMSRDFTLMIDCGGTDWKNAGDIASEYLLLRGKDTINALVVTGFDDKYINGIHALCDLVAVKSIYLLNADYEKTLRATAPLDEKTAITYITGGKTLNCGSFGALLLVPPNYIDNSTDVSSADFISVLIDTKQSDVFIPGAAENSGLLMSTEELRSAEILILNGGLQLLSDDFLEAIQPDKLYLSSKRIPEPTEDEENLLSRYDLKISATALLGLQTATLADRRR